MDGMSQAEQHRRDLVSNIAFLQEALQQYENRHFIVGVDPSLSDTAIAAIGPGTEAGRWSIKMYDSPIITRDSTISQTKRLAVLRAYAIKVFRRHPAKLVAIEDYAYSSKQNRELMGEVGNVLRLCVFHDYPELVGLVLVVTASQLKKYIVGKFERGEKSIKKEKILQRLAIEYRLEPDNNNQGDAAALAIIARDLVRVVSEVALDRFYDAGGGYDDQHTRDFIKSGRSDWKLAAYKWEVLMSLLANRCGQQLYDFQPRENVVADPIPTAAAS